MANERKIAQHVKRYKNFINLYPKHFRERFAQPMLRTFTDMLNEHSKSKEVTWAFVLKIYLDTAKEIIKENSKEVAVSFKTKKPKVLIWGGFVGLLALVAILALINSSKNSGIIPYGSSVAEGRAISKGKTEKCLPENQAAVDAINKDDVVESFEIKGKQSEISKFAIEAVSGFRDIPAGTEAEVFRNSYDGKMATGSVVYPQDYGSYNYKIEKLSEAGRWEIVSLYACE